MSFVENDRVVKLRRFDPTGLAVWVLAAFYEPAISLAPPGAVSTHMATGHIVNTLGRCDRTVGRGTRQEGKYAAVSYGDGNFELSGYAQFSLIESITASTTCGEGT